MMSSAHHHYGSSHADYVYKDSYPNHPSTVWVRSSRKHYVWLYRHAREMCRLYENYSGKPHGCVPTLRRLKNTPSGLHNLGFVRPPVAGPDDLKHLPVIEAYEQILIRKYNEWLTRTKPIKVEFVGEAPNFWRNM